MSFPEAALARHTGMTATCSGYIDAKTQKYVKNDLAEKSSCCFDLCSAPVDFCNDYCETRHSSQGPEADPVLLLGCKEMCQDQIDICRDSCGRDPDIDKSYYKRCAVELGCDQGNGVLDRDCIQKHTEELVKCCQANCIPDDDVDCSAHCDLLHVVHGNLLLPKDISIPKADYKKYRDYTWIYIPAGILAGLVIAGIVIYLRKRK